MKNSGLDSHLTRGAGMPRAATRFAKRFAPETARSVRFALVLLTLFVLAGASTESAAAIAERGAATTKAGTADATTLVINVPSGVVAGDVMIANIVEYDAVSGYPTCSGWTLIQSAAFAATKTGHGAVLYKVSTLSLIHI